MSVLSSIKCDIHSSVNADDNHCNVHTVHITWLCSDGHKVTTNHDNDDHTLDSDWETLCKLGS